jgi:probable HAF family extracellular repeat protein
MFPTTNPRDPIERAPLTRLPRRGPAVTRRSVFRPELERVEDRCLLSSYNISDMTFPGGYMYVVTVINDLGQVAGRGVVPGVSDHAVVWENGSIIDLDPQQLHGTTAPTDMTNPPPGHEADVQVVGTMPTATYYDVFLWVGGTMYVTLIPYMSMGTSPGWAVDISNSGVVAGGYNAGGQGHAYVWQDLNGNHSYSNNTTDPGEFQDLNGLFPNATASSAADIIDATSRVPHRQIVANAFVPIKGSGQWRAYLLTDQLDNGFSSGVVVTDLGTLPGSASAHASAINDVGQIVGVSGSDAFLWQNGVMSDLGQFNRGTPDPYAINHGGQAVGVDYGTNRNPRAWIWTGSKPIQDLNGLIPKRSGWLLQEARGINDSGQIVGDGQGPAGDARAFLLTPTSAPAVAFNASTPEFAGPKAQSSALAPVDPLVLDDLARWLSTGAKARRTPAIGPR